jgi:RHS repeat-associated protein
VDEAGNPLYYLTDAMGSVIGLVDGNGQEVAEFRYDSFGNLQTPENLPQGLGGDFRFQGQWLESNTDLYHFRARYYDPETGRFVSHDPVEVIERVPESSNPYQFVYNNPYVYSDPSGEITISELNSAQSIQHHLASIRRYVGAEAKDYVLERIGETFGNVVLSSFNAIVPGSTIFDDIISGVSDFERGITGVVCNYLEGLPLKDNLYIEARIQNGIPRDNGLNCGNHNQQQLNTRAARRFRNLPGSRPDFLFRNTPPRSYSSKDSGAYLIGDIKFALGYARRDITASDNQWEEMVKYARQYQLLPFVSYLALSNSNFLHSTDREGRGLSSSDRKRLAGIALQQGVILILVNLIEG